MFDDRGKNKFAIFFALYLLIGVLIRLYYLSQFSISPLFNIPIGPDVEEYTKWAHNILAGQWLWNSVHIHSPLYPYFLALLFRLYSGSVSLFKWVRFTQLFIGLVAVIPLYLSLEMALADNRFKEGPKEQKESLFQNRIIKGIFLFSWLCYPPLIFYMGELTSEVLVIPLLSLSIFFIYKSEQYSAFEYDDAEPETKITETSCRKFRYICFGGFAAGLAVVAHPMVLFFLFWESIYLLILPLIAFKKQTGLRTPLLRFMFFIIFAVLPVMPVVIYNTMLLKEPVPLQANSGFNFYLGNGPEADGTCRLRPGPEWERVHAEAEKAANCQGISKDQYFFKESLRFITEHPFQWLKVLAKKALYVWNEKELTAGADIYPLRYFTAFQRNTNWSFGVVAVLALFAIFINMLPAFYKPEERRLFFYRYRHFLILILAFWGAQTLLVTSGRYRIPMLIAVLVLAAAGAASLICELRKGHKRAVIAFPAALLVASGIVYLPNPPFHLESEVAEAHSLLGEAFIKQGHYSEAEAMLLAAAKYQPDWSRNYNLLGLISEEEKRYYDALGYYKRAIECDPEDPEGYVNIATLYANRGMLDETEHYFSEALALKKATPSLYYNYALYCSEKGDFNRAVKYYQAALKLDPSNVQALNNLGTTYFQQGEFGQAIEYFKSALLLEPDNPEKMVNLALAYLKNGEMDMAEDMVEKAASIAPDMPVLHILREEIQKQRKVR